MIIAEKTCLDTIATSIEALKRNPDRRTPPPPKCKACQDIGYIFTEDERGQSWAHRCLCRTGADVQTRYRIANIPEIFRSESLKTFKTENEKQREYKSLCQEYVNTFEPGTDGLFLYGNPGTGKTHLAISILRALLDKGVDGYFMTLKEYYDKIMGTFNDKSRHKDEVTIKPKTVKILVVDDIGAEKISDWRMDESRTLLDYRYNHGLTTIFTSNFTKNQLLEIVGQRIVSRMGNAYALRFSRDDGFRDMRQK